MPEMVAYCGAGSSWSGARSFSWMVERAVALRERGSERFAGSLIGQVELFGDKSSGSVRLWR